MKSSQLLFLDLIKVIIIKIGIFSILFNEWGLEKSLEYFSKLGYEAVEFAAWKGSNHIDIEKIINGEATKFKKKVEKYGLEISALSNHLEGQLVLGPHDSSTDEWFTGSAEEKINFGTERMKKTAEAAAALDVPVVNGFVGTPNWGAWYIFPPKNQEIFDSGFKLLAERWGDILDTFKAYGIKFAHEVHPQEQIYNIETAEKAIKTLNGNKTFGFNFDPSHFIWQDIDPVIFLKKFRDRIFHVHAKDGELVRENLPFSGRTATGPWTRTDRGFRFRVVGWGNVEWKRIITGLSEIGYNYVMSYEHEDPVMSREDGCEKCINFLKPLMINAPLETVWW